RHELLQHDLRAEAGGLQLRGPGPALGEGHLPADRRLPRGHWFRLLGSVWPTASDGREEAPAACPRRKAGRERTARGYFFSASLTSASISLSRTSSPGLPSHLWRITPLASTR